MRPMASTQAQMTNTLLCSVSLISVFADLEKAICNSVHLSRKRKNLPVWLFQFPTKINPSYNQRLCWHFHRVLYVMAPSTINTKSAKASSKITRKQLA